MKFDISMLQGTNPKFSAAGVTFDKYESRPSNFKLQGNITEIFCCRELILKFHYCREEIINFLLQGWHLINMSQVLKLQGNSKNFAAGSEIWNYNFAGKKIYIFCCRGHIWLIWVHAFQFKVARKNSQNYLLQWVKFKISMLQRKNHKFSIAGVTFDYY